MSVLVTGGEGFVGVHVVRGLAAAGERVVSLGVGGGLDADGQALLGDLGHRVAFLEGDVRDLSALRRVIKAHEVERIVHGAAVTAIGDMEREAAHVAVMVNVGGTTSTLEAARLASVRRFVYVSSAMVYGAGDQAVSIGEDRETRPTGIYAITKRAAEALVLRYMDLFGLDAVILRLSAPYGPLEHPTESRRLMSPIFTWCRAARAGMPVCLAADLERDFTFVGDTADAIVRAVRADGLPERIYNVAAGRNVRFSEVLATHGRLWPGLDFTHVGQREVDSFFLESLRGPLEVVRAQRDLGWSPRTNLAEGLNTYLDWLGSHRF